uniref:Uncharacterized protein n=1 Tax=Parascaris equorum TaxID=6256 RepID=A0A914S2J7_PAREQ
MCGSTTTSIMSSSISPERKNSLGDVSADPSSVVAKLAIPNIS